MLVRNTTRARRLCALRTCSGRPRGPVQFESTACATPRLRPSSAAERSAAWRPACPRRAGDGGRHVRGRDVQVGEVSVAARLAQVEGNPVRAPRGRRPGVAEAISRLGTRRIRSARRRGRGPRRPGGLGAPRWRSSTPCSGGDALAPATKGGRSAASSGCAPPGSQTNDVFDRRATSHHFAGGISGGSNGAESSCASPSGRDLDRKPQTAATKEGGTPTIAIQGRHDPCICPRVVPVAEAMMAIALADAWLRQRALRGRSA